MFENTVFWLQIAAIVLEPIGVLFLSVEAIKLENLSRLRESLYKPYRILNPKIEWVDEELSPTKRTLASKIISGIVLIIGGMLFVPFYALIATPIVLLLAMSVKFLNWIQNNTQTGMIGVTGFALWFISFLINRFTEQGG